MEYKYKEGKYVVPKFYLFLVDMFQPGVTDCLNGQPPHTLLSFRGELFQRQKNRGQDSLCDIGSINVTFYCRHRHSMESNKDKCTLMFKNRGKDERSEVEDVQGRRRLQSSYQYNPEHICCDLLELSQT